MVVELRLLFPVSCRQVLFSREEVTVVGRRCIILRALNSHARPISMVKVDGKFACMSVWILSFNPVTKQLTFLSGASELTFTNNFSNRA